MKYDREVSGRGLEKAWEENLVCTLIEVDFNGGNSLFTLDKFERFSQKFSQVSHFLQGHTNNLDLE